MAIGEIRGTEIAEGVNISAPDDSQPASFGDPDGSNVQHAVTVNYLSTIGSGNKNNFGATTDPSVSNDNTEDYSVGSFWFNTSIGNVFIANDVSTGAAVWRDIVLTHNSQIIINKDIDGGTASNSKRITIPKETKANLDALTRKEGTIVFGTDTNKFYIDDGASLVDVSSSFGDFFTLTTVTAQKVDYIPISDTSDTNSNKKVLVSDITNAIVENHVGATTASSETDTVTGDTGTAAFTTTLPAAGNAGKRLKLVKIGSDNNAWTIDGNGTETIDGSLTKALHAPGESIEIEDDGTNWIIVNRTGGTGSFTVTYSGQGFASSQAVTVNFYKIDNYITLYFQSKTATGQNPGVPYIESAASVPANFRPANDATEVIQVYDNAVTQAGAGKGFVRTSGVTRIYKSLDETATYTASTTIGHDQWTISYVI